ncbi:unnamed protein product [Lactuca virosa]|uniref:SCP domain-containing protein n=1 Tax=Lactuca virosa TaxID=75947 RepID=A0AAU9NUA1_9ASTR|nr:unnamed protein product [Lactuca virosa]
MGPWNNALFLLAIFMGILNFSLAQNSPQDFVDAHNQARAQVGVGPMTWDSNVAGFAENYANQRRGDCQLVHSQNSPYEKMCGHYTQVVWRNSVRLGCARVQCNNDAWFVTCNYDPPGNYVGEKPY